MARKVNQNRKEKAFKNPLSCNAHYFKSAKTIGMTRQSEFLTDDYSRPRLQNFDPFDRACDRRGIYRLVWRRYSFSAPWNSLISFSTRLTARRLAKFTIVCVVNYFIGLQILKFPIETLTIDEALAPILVVAVMVPSSLVGTRLALVGSLTKNTQGSVKSSPVDGNGLSGSGLMGLYQGALMGTHRDAFWVTCSPILLPLIAPSRESGKSRSEKTKLMNQQSY